VGVDLEAWIINHEEHREQGLSSSGSLFGFDVDKVATELAECFADQGMLFWSDVLLRYALWAVAVAVES
jgi:hypothetical protein